MGAISTRVTQKSIDLPDPRQFMGSFDLPPFLEGGEGSFFFFSLGSVTLTPNWLYVPLYDYTPQKLL